MRVSQKTAQQTRRHQKYMWISLSTVAAIGIFFLLFYASRNVTERRRLPAPKDVPLPSSSSDSSSLDESERAGLESTPGPLPASSEEKTQEPPSEASRNAISVEPQPSVDQRAHSYVLKGSKATRITKRVNLRSDQRISDLEGMTWEDKKDKGSTVSLRIKGKKLFIHFHNSDREAKITRIAVYGDGMVIQKKEKINQDKHWLKILEKCVPRLKKFRGDERKILDYTSMIGHGLQFEFIQRELHGEDEQLDGFLDELLENLHGQNPTIDSIIELSEDRIKQITNHIRELSNAVHVKASQFLLEMWDVAKPEVCYCLPIQKELYDSIIWHTQDIFTELNIDVFNVPEIDGEDF